MKKKFLASIIFASVTLLLGACGGGSGTGSTDTPKEDGAKQGAKASEQIIEIGVPTEIVTVDTIQATDKNTFTVLHQIYEGLYRLDENSQPVPAIAKEVSISDDGKEYVFTLREDAKWSNGEQITADDFVYSWKKLVDPKTGAPNAYLLDNVLNSLDIRTEKLPVDDLGVSAPAPDQFKVVLEQPQASFLTLLSIVWLAPQNQSYVEEQGKDFGIDSEHVLFNGPFILTDWEQGSDTWTLKKNPEYYDAERVHLSEVRGQTMKEENTGINLYQSGDIDLTKISGQYVAELQDDPGFVTHSDIANNFIDFNQKEGTPLANVHLRKAISLAIDKEALAQNVLNDGAKPLNGLIPHDLFTNPDTEEDFRAYSGEYALHDVKKAQKEWKEAQKELGEEVTLSLLVSDDDSGRKVSEYVQSQLQENLEGLSIEIQQQPKTNVNQSRREKDFELSISGWLAGDNNLDIYFNLYVTDSAYNYGSYSNQTYDELTRAAKTVDANDVTKMFEDYKEAEKILLEEDAAQVPLYQSASNYLINPKIKKIGYPSYGCYFYLGDAYLEE